MIYRNKGGLSIRIRKVNSISFIHSYYLSLSVFFPSAMDICLCLSVSLTIFEPFACLTVRLSVFCLIPSPSGPQLPACLSEELLRLNAPQDDDVEMGLPDKPGRRPGPGSSGSPSSPGISSFPNTHITTSAGLGVIITLFCPFGLPKK